MNILIACEESQRVCIEFRKRGFNAFSCDIQDCSGNHPEWHIKGDVIPILNGNCTFQTTDAQTHIIRGRWDLIIAHPPCTYLSAAGACRMYRIINKERYINEKRYFQMLDGKKFFLKMIVADCDHVAVENPTPLKLCNLPPYSQVIQPYEFGHPYSKRTLLWLRGLPKLNPTKIVEEYVPLLPSNTSGFAKGRGGSRGAVRGAKNFSKTFQGIAAAMAEQWGNYLMEVKNNGDN